MNNKQRWMGGVVLLGGGVLLVALLLKGKNEIHQSQMAISPPAVEEKARDNSNPAPISSETTEMVQLQPLGVDVETEKRLLEEQRRAREKAIAEQDARTAEFLIQQQKAEAAAARKAAAENAAISARRTVGQEGSDNIAPEIDKQATVNNQSNQEEPKKKDEEKRRAEEKQLEQKKKQQEMDAAKRKAEQERVAKDKKQAEEKRRLEAEKLAEEKKKKAEAEAKKKTEADKARALLEDTNKNWMVQVALAANQANADALVAKLRAKGYKVVTSPTSKGIRIMVGPSKSREAADLTRQKIVSDSSLNMKSAWVIDWVPLDQR